MPFLTELGNINRKKDIRYSSTGMQESISHDVLRARHSYEHMTQLA